MLVQPVESHSHGRDKFKRNDIRYVESEGACTKVPKANGKRRDIIHGVTLTSFRSKRIRLKLVEGGSRPVDTRQRGGIRMSNSSNFLPSRSRFRDRRLPFLRFSLCRRRAERATATGVRGDIRRNCEGCEGEGGNGAGNRALRERERGRIPPLYL